MNKNTDNGKIINVKMKLDCKTVRNFAYSSTPRFTDFFTDFEKKTQLFCSLRWNDITERDDDMNPWKQTQTLVSLPMIFQNSAQSTLFQ